MFQIVFNEISAAEISRLDTLEQLELLDEFKVTENDLENLGDERFGKIERDGRVLYRFRAQDWRFYFEVKDGFPRLTSGSVPMGVIKATYEIDLDKAAGPSVSTADALKKLRAI